MGRLKKLVIIAAVGGAFVVFAKRLMGGLGPQPGTDMAPKAWPSLVPEPTTPPEPSANGASNGNGSAPATSGEGTEATEADATTD